MTLTGKRKPGNIDKSKQQFLQACKIWDENKDAQENC